MSALTWQTVAVFAHRPMAEVAGSALRSRGIPFRLVADDLGGTTGLPLGGAYQGVEVQVPVDRAEEAQALLDGGVDDEVGAWDTGEHGQGRWDGDAEEVASRPLSMDRSRLGIGIGRVVLAVVLLALLIAAIPQLTSG